MTEIERMLTDTLTALEQELRQAQEAQAKNLSGQDRTLTAHTEALCHLQKQVLRLKVQQQELTQRLQHLENIYKNLDPLLVHLNSIFEEIRRR